MCIIVRVRRLKLGFVYKLRCTSPNAMHFIDKSKTNYIYLYNYKVLRVCCMKINSNQIILYSFFIIR